jgi:hypothetical protein
VNSPLVTYVEVSELYDVSLPLVTPFDFMTILTLNDSFLLFRAYLPPLAALALQQLYGKRGWDYIAGHSCTVYTFREIPFQALRSFSLLIVERLKRLP